MAKITAWLVTLIGVLLVLSLLNLTIVSTEIQNWVIALAVLAIGVSKLLRNYKIMKI